MPSYDALTEWQASGWDELRGIWGELIGVLAGERRPAEPGFRGNTISKAEAGYVLQTWIVEAFRHSYVECDGPFRVPSNPGIDNRTLAEIDGFVSIEQNNFLIESKFEKVDFSPIARLHLLAEQRPVGTMGLLFAAGGYTQPALDAAHILRPIRVLLLTADDIEFAVRQGDISRMVRLKLQKAAKYGRANLPVEAD